MTDATRLRELLTQAGLSQRAFAREANVSARMVTYWLAERQPVPRVALMAAQYLAGGMVGLPQEYVERLRAIGHGDVVSAIIWLVDEYEGRALLGRVRQTEEEIADDYHARVGETAGKD